MIAFGRDCEHFIESYGQFCNHLQKSETPHVQGIYLGMPGKPPKNDKNGDYQH